MKAETEMRVAKVVNFFDSVSGKYLKHWAQSSRTRDGGRLRMLHIFLLLVLGGASFHSRADQPPSPTDSEAFHKLRGIVKERQFYFKDMLSRSPEETEYCQRLLTAVIDGTQIKVIEPYHRTDSLDDSALERWKECGENPNVTEGLGYYPATGTRGFRLYKVDADNNQRNGLEDVLYSEWDFKEVSGPAGFSWWDLKTCKVRGGAPAQQDDKRDANGKGELGDNYALLVKYESRTLALTMNSLSGFQLKNWRDEWKAPEDYYMNASRLDPKSKSSKSPNITDYSCSWSTIQTSASRSIRGHN